MPMNTEDKKVTALLTGLITRTEATLHAEGLSAKEIDIAVVAMAAIVMSDLLAATPPPEIREDMEKTFGFLSSMARIWLENLHHC